LDARSQTKVVLDEVAAQTATRMAGLGANMSEESRRMSSEFSEALASERQDALTAARHDLTLLTASSVAQLRGVGRAQEAELAQPLSTLRDQAMNDSRKRLEGASNSWLLTTATRLDQQSQQLIQSITTSAQKQIREACAQVFGDLGEKLRQ